MEKNVCRWVSVLFKRFNGTGVTAHPIRDPVLCSLLQGL